MSKNWRAPTDYIVHVSHDPEDGTAYFGPVPEDTHDPLNGEASDYWAQTGDIDIIYASKIPDDAYINPWSVWLDPNSEEVTNPS